jgi:hypothetical protein
MNRRSYCTITRSLTAAAVMALCPFLVRAGSPYAGIESGRRCLDADNEIQVKDT